MNPRFKKLLSVLLMLVLLIQVLHVVIAGGQEEEGDWLEYTFFDADKRDAPSKVQNIPNDVVTPYIENRFKIRVKEMYGVTTQPFEERLNQWIASDTLPDVMRLAPGEAAHAIATGEFADITVYIQNMKNLKEYMDADFWPHYALDGRIYQIPQIQINQNAPQYENDPYALGLSAWCLWVREDILKKAGYSFTPIDEIKKITTDVGIKPTKEQLKIDPPIDTPEAFYTFLKKVKELNLEVEGKPVYPMSMVSWNQFHVGSIFDFGHWNISENGEVSGFLGTKEAKEYYRFLNRLYQEGLLDNDFIIQKNEQLQEKVASGRVACGMSVPDLNAAIKSMRHFTPDARIRYIPWPKKHPDKGFFDIYIPGFYRFIVKKDFPDIERLTQYFDWFYSDEGLETVTWGPESSGLWEVKDGKKEFADKEIEEYMLNGVHGKKGADYYGLYDPFNPFEYWSKAAVAAPVIARGNPKSYLRSYPPRMDILLITKNMLGASGLNMDGTASYGGLSENVSAVWTYFWSEFQNNKCAKLLTATSDEEFNKAWDEVFTDFLVRGRYEAAEQDMEEWFEMLSK